MIAVSDYAWQRLRDSDAAVRPVAGPYADSSRRSFILHELDEFIHTEPRPHCYAICTRRSTECRADQAGSVPFEKDSRSNSVSTDNHLETQCLINLATTSLQLRDSPCPLSNTGSRQSCQLTSAACRRRPRARPGGG